MEIRIVTQVHDVLIVSADGGLDAGNAEAFVADLERLIDQGVRRIVVDCAPLHYISSVGLAVLLRLHKTLARHGGDVRLAAVQGMLMQAIAMARLDAVFSIYPDVNRALLSFREKRDPIA